MVEGNSQNIRHVTPHHVWAYLHAAPATELSTAEHDHILECERCLLLFSLCLRSETFASVLKELGREFDGRRSA